MTDIRDGAAGGSRVRVLMVDVDGVIVRHPPGRAWHSDLESDLGIDPLVLGGDFFEANFTDVVLGRVELTDRVASLLAEHGSDVDAETLIDYWFRHDATLDTDLLRYLASLRERGIALHVATVQEHRRARYLWEGLDLRSRFDAMHYAADLGYAKPDPGFFAEVARRTGFHPAEMLLIDDLPENVAAARAAGWHALLWTPGSSVEEITALVGAG